MIFSCFSIGIEVEVIKNPKPTCFEKKEMYVPLKMVNMISGEESESENFLGEGRWVTADGNGNVFVSDRIFTEIFKYDKDLNFKKRFGSRGEGPGEFTSHRFSGGIRINICDNNYLYAKDPGSGRVTVFDLNGKYITDHKTYFRYSFNPEADKAGNLYVPSINGGVIDIFDKKMTLTGVLLDDKALLEFLYYEPGSKIKEFFTKPYVDNIKFSLLNNDMLIIYIFHSSTVYLLQNRKLKKKFYIWPEKEMEPYKKHLHEVYKQGDDMYVNFAVNFFIDEDDKQFFYLQFGLDKVNRIIPVYKFDLSGQLKQIYYVRHKEGNILSFEYKRNNIFYGVVDGSVFLYR